MSDFFFVWFICAMPIAAIAIILYLEWYEDEFIYYARSKQEKARARIHWYGGLTLAFLLGPFALLIGLLVGIGFGVRHVYKTFQDAYGAPKSSDEGKTPLRLFKRKGKS